MDELSRRLAGLSEEKRALLAKRLRDSERQENAFPLSVMQQRIWFLEQLDPHNIAYLIPAAVRIRGELDVAVLRAVISEIVRRHESLRTTFELRGGRPVQVVSSHPQVELPEDDLRELIGEAPDGVVDKRIAEELAAPLDLATGPLLRLRLLRVADQEHVLVMVMHHIVSDGWSLGILVSELACLYEAFVAGRPSPLPALPIQYADFAAWHQERLRTTNLKDDLDYWRQHLAGAPLALDLPTDRPRPPVQTFRGGSVPFELPAPLMREVAAIGQRNGATTFMALLAAFKVLLHRYSTQEDVIVGVPVAGRNRADLEGLIGFFVNTLPVRSDLSGNPSFETVLERVRDACLGAYAHQDLPFEKLVEQVRPARDLSRPPVFQVSFSYQNAPLQTFRVAGLEVSRMPLQSVTARFDLELQFFDEAGGLSGWFEYNSDLLDRATIMRMAGHYRRLVEQLVTRAEAPVNELPLLTDEERQRVLVQSNATERRWPQHGLVHQCFERQVEATPEAEAVRFEGESLSYRELDRRANQLAHRLRRSAVGRDVPVGVCMERSLEMVVSLLAVLKAGGAYLPLDPDHPRGRLELMIEDGQLPVLLTQQRLRERLPQAAAEVWCVDELAGDLAGEPDTSPGVEIDGEDLAYVIYTSGSTGRPNGAMNLHAGIRNRLLWMQDAFPLSPGDRVLQKTPFSFDVSVWEFFWPLMTGACLVVARPGGHKDSRYLVETIRAERITTVHFVPSMLRIFLQEPQVAECDSLRHVICSGEALPRELQDRFFACSTAELHNLYGPTEAAVDVTSWTCRRDNDARPVPIGYPIANTQTYVLDQFRQPVPVGVPGELCIGGRNLARGYLNRPELTAQRFVEHPFDQTPGARVYRTGDLARYREDGAIEFLGRLDHQVKVRGFRVELGEIEEALAAHPRVHAAIVTARPHPAGDTRLVAYLTGDDGTTPEELGGFLRDRLPDYMIPAAFVFLPGFPLLPNGKVDRRSLPEPGFERANLATPYEEPRDQLERAIVGAWAQVLGTDKIGVHDNFFDLGGHSLLLAELRNLLETTLERPLSMVEMFQRPTVRSLAEHLHGAGTLADPLANARQRVASRQRSAVSRQRTAAVRRSRTAGDGVGGS